MPAFLKTDEDERLWSKAKARAKEEGRSGDWAYITGIYKQMKGGKVALDLRRITANVTERWLRARAV